jgi:hypothetical protein
MPFPRWSFLVLVAAWFGAVAARAEIEFVGVLVTSDRASFALSEAPGSPTVWRTSGQVFAGYTISSFDAKTDTLTLTKAGVPLVLHLVDEARVKTARIDIVGDLTIGARGKLEVTRATLLFDQENDFPLADDLLLRLTPERLPDGTIRYRAIFERTRPNGKEIISAPTVIALKDSPFRIQVGDYGFGFQPTPRPRPVTPP